MTDQWITQKQLKNNLFLAPMAGITDAPFRSLCQDMGCALTYTEMVSAKGLYYKDKKTKELLKKGSGEKDYVIQLFGNDPQIIAYGVQAVEMYQPLWVDINMGCPAPKIVKNQEGVYLMRQPQLVGKIIEKAAKASKLKVSVKIRAGFEDQKNALEIAKIAQESGAGSIAVHPRTREMFYGGKADWSLIRQIKDQLSIPVIGNGDIFEPQDALDMQKITQCDAVMIARGARGNPWLFKHILQLQKGETIGEVSLEEKVDVMKNHLQRMVEEKGEHRGVMEMRKHGAWYVKGLYQSTQIKTHLFQAKTQQQMEQAFMEILT